MCGMVTIDVEMLRTSAIYEGCSATDAHVGCVPLHAHCCRLGAACVEGAALPFPIPNRSQFYRLGGCQGFPRMVERLRLGMLHHVAACSSHPLRRAAFQSQTLQVAMMLPPTQRVACIAFLVLCCPAPAGTSGRP